MSSRNVITEKLLALAARVTSGQSSGFAVWDRIEAICLINVTAMSGGSPTLDMVIEISDDNVTWYTHSTFAQVIAVGKYARAMTNFGKYVRANYTIGGAGPSFTFEVKFMGKT